MVTDAQVEAAAKAIVNELRQRGISVFVGDGDDMIHAARAALAAAEAHEPLPSTMCENLTAENRRLKAALAAAERIVCTLLVEAGAATAEAAGLERKLPLIEKSMATGRAAGRAEGFREGFEAAAGAQSILNDLANRGLGEVMGKLTFSTNATADDVNAYWAERFAGVDAAIRNKAVAALREAMNLDHALRVLAEVHTDWDEKTGFTIRMGATPQSYAPWLFQDYGEAWRVVRMHLNLNVNPSPRAALTEGIKGIKEGGMER